MGRPQQRLHFGSDGRSQLVSTDAKGAITLWDLEGRDATNTTTAAATKTTAAPTSRHRNSNSGNNNASSTTNTTAAAAAGAAATAAGKFSRVFLPDVVAAMNSGVGSKYHPVPIISR